MAELFLKLFSSIIILATPILASSQTGDTAYLNHIGAQMRRLQRTGIMYYSDKLDKGRINRILADAQPAFKDLENRGLTFDNAEKRYILSAIRNTTKQTVEDSLFESSRRLSNDTLNRFLERSFMKTIDSLRHSPDSFLAMQYYYKMRPWAFSFSKPIYLREKTILLYYFMYYFNSSGADGVEVYEKNSNGWNLRGLSVAAHGGV